MPIIVPDASAILALAYHDEDADYAQAVVEAIAADRGIVPTILWYEIRNALLVGERRKRITPAQTHIFLANLALLPLEVDEIPRESVVFDLAHRYHLTIYDAAYLELAKRHNAPLATVDGALIKASRAAGVAIWKKV